MLGALSLISPSDPHLSRAKESTEAVACSVAVGWPLLLVEQSQTVQDGRISSAVGEHRSQLSLTRHYQRASNVVRVA